MEYAAPRPAEIAPSTFLQRVFAWMFAGLAVTAVCALAIGSNQRLLTAVISNPVLLIGLFVVELAVVVVLSAAINRLSVPMALTLFFIYAALNGVVFAFVFELYTRESIFTTFLIAAAMFGAVALWGYTTKRDLSRLGTVLFMALIGLILATFVNFFVGGSTLYWITTYAGVVIFCGLTAYDMQKLKALASAGGAGEQQDERRAIQGALALYLDFINLFLFLLRIFGRSR
jgi:FtsH-binding integral membrane protein